jgi:hypothetical protein
MNNSSNNDSIQKTPDSFKRNYRIGGIAVFDLVLTIIATICIVSLKYDISQRNGIIKIFQLLFYIILFGSTVHKLLHIDTMLNYYIGCSKDPTTLY